MITKSRGPFQKICHPNVRSFRNGGTETSRQRDHARKPRRGRRRCPAAGAQRPPPRHVVLRLQNTRQRRRERPEREVASQARGGGPAASRLGESVAGGAWRPVLKEVVFGLGRQAPRARRARSHAQSPPHGLLRGGARLRGGGARLRGGAGAGRGCVAGRSHSGGGAAFAGPVCRPSLRGPVTLADALGACDTLHSGTGQRRLGRALTPPRSQRLPTPSAQLGGIGVGEIGAHSWSAAPPPRV